MREIATNILDTIGNTPIIRLQRLFAKENVYAKMESANPAGSMKDRTSRLIVSKLLQAGIIKRGGTVIESSSGNMAVGLAQVCRFYGLNLKIVVDVNLNPQNYKLLKAYGAEVIEVREPLKEGGFLAARLKKVNELLEENPGSIWTNQYANPNNPKAYDAVMREITDTLEGKLDYLFVATSTCGSLMGCANFIERNNLSTKLIAVDAKGSVLFGGQPGDRRIPGHGAGGVPSKFLDIRKISDVIHVSDIDCINGCHKLLEKEAILAGGSSGGGIISAFKEYRKTIPKNATSVLLLPDSGERYVDTIYNDEWRSKSFKNEKNAQAESETYRLEHGVYESTL